VGGARRVCVALRTHEEVIGIRLLIRSGLSR
jgi:hypothetical protein